VSVTFGEYFGWKGTIPSNLRWSGKTRDILILYGVEILTDDYFVLPQYSHLTDGRTDGQNCDRNSVRCITCSRTIKTVAKQYGGSREGLLLCIPLRPTTNTFHTTGNAGLTSPSLQQSRIKTVILNTVTAIVGIRCHAHTSPVFRVLLFLVRSIDYFRPTINLRVK